MTIKLWCVESVETIGDNEVNIAPMGPSCSYWTMLHNLFTASQIYLLLQNMLVLTCSLLLEKVVVNQAL